LAAGHGLKRECKPPIGNGTSQGSARLGERCSGSVQEGVPEGGVKVCAKQLTKQKSYEIGSVVHLVALATVEVAQETLRHRANCHSVYMSLQISHHLFV
jgi:hypothetical protein